MKMYENKTYEKIKKDILDKISNKLDKREGSFINDMVSPYCLELESAYEEFKYLLDVMFLNNINTEKLELRANEYGISRKQGEKSTGSVTFTGIGGAIITKGTLVSTSTGMLFETGNEGIIKPTENTITVPIIAKEVGDMYNLEAGSINKLPILISGVTAITNKTNTLGGLNRETDNELLERVLDKIRNPSNGGNIADFRRWAIEVDGVGDAKIIPLWNGNGTVKVVPITTAKRSPDERVISKVKKNREIKKPIFGEVTVVGPSETIVNIKAKIKIDSKYNLEYIKSEYMKRIKKYIEDSVFKIYTLDCYKCLSFFYDIEGVTEVMDFTLNGIKDKLSIDGSSIQVLGTIDIDI